MPRTRAAVLSVHRAALPLPCAVGMSTPARQRLVFSFPMRMVFSFYPHVYVYVYDLCFISLLF